MAHDAHTHDAHPHDARLPVGGVRFSHLVAATTGMVFLTILLGVATKATGAGLACQARWPVCDGGLLNLFPQSFPSFFEWIHRVVAGTAGLFILGAAAAAWRTDVGSGVRRAVTLGLVLLPIQVLLGRETVLSFTLPVLAAHFWVAFTIFASFATATALAWRHRLSTGVLRKLALVAVALVPVQIVLHPPVVTSFTPVIQTIQYAVTFTVLTAAVTLAVVGRDVADSRTRTASLLAVAAHPLLVLVGRQLVDPTTALLAVYAVLAVTLLGALAVSSRGFGTRATV